jgi:phage repressor protein C with HTH and peptisase S24 domain
MGPGFDVHSGQVVDHFEFRKAWIKARGLDPERLVLIEGIGDSMKGVLEHKDILLIDTRKTTRRTGIIGSDPDQSIGKGSIKHSKRLIGRSSGANNIALPSGL